MRRNPRGLIYTTVQTVRPDMAPTNLRPHILKSIFLALKLRRQSRVHGITAPTLAEEGRRACEGSQTSGILIYIYIHTYI